MAEKLFSLVSLCFLTVGFIVGIAGADKDGAKDLAHATDQLIQHVTYADEANKINQPTTVVSITPANVDEIRKQNEAQDLALKFPEKKTR
ncbi:MAG: hypothetical protein AB7F59_07205 [Bdellovibrionales bacterium]